MFKKVLSNTVYQVGGKMITAIISIFLLNILTNYLPIHLFGEYGKIYNYLLIFAFLADLGLYTISIREINKDKSKASYIIGNILTLRLLLGICIIIVSLLIATILPGYNSLVSLISIGIVGIFTLFSLVNSSILALMQSYLKMEFSLFSAVFGKIINLSLIVVIIFFIFPAHAVGDYFVPFLCIMGAGLLGNMITTSMNFYYAQKIVPVSFLYDFKYIQHIFKISIPYGIAIFLGVVYMKIDIILLSLLESPEKANISIALYSVPMKIMEVFMVTGTFFLNSMLPTLSQNFSTKNTVAIQSTLKLSYIFLLIGSVLMFVFGYVFKNQMIQAIANVDYLDRDIYPHTSSDAFVIVLFMIVFYFMFLVFQYIFIAAEKQEQLLKINIYITIFNIIGNLIMIPKYSFVGAGIITVISQFLLMCLGYYYSRDIIRFQIPKLMTLQILFGGYVLYVILSFLSGSITQLFS